jgi:hypothetical protein
MEFFEGVQPVEKGSLLNDNETIDMQEDCTPLAGTTRQNRRRPYHE